jgi:hypothetical protein
MTRVLAPLSAIAFAMGFGLATEAVAGDDDFYFNEQTPTPPAVLALADCGADERTAVHRKTFGGGFVFAVQRASNNENFVETLIFAESEDGIGGRLLRFPRPAQRGGGVQDTISNIRWYEDTREIGEIFVDREDPPLCRIEAR